MKWINATKYVTAERKLGGIIYASGCKALWWFYLLRIKFLYSPKSPLYRADFALATVNALFLGFSCLAAAAGISYFYSDHTSVSSETTVIPPQVDVSPKVPAPKSTIFDTTLFKAPPEGTILNKVHYVLVLAGTGFLIYGVWFLITNDAPVIPQNTEPPVQRHMIKPGKAEVD